MVGKKFSPASRRVSKSLVGVKMRFNPRKKAKITGKIFEHKYSRECEGVQCIARGRNPRPSMRNLCFFSENRAVLMLAGVQRRRVSTSPAGVKSHRTPCKNANFFRAYSADGGSQTLFEGSNVDLRQRLI